MLLAHARYVLHVCIEFVHCAAAPADVHSQSDGALAAEMVEDFIATYATIKMQDSDEKKAPIE